MINKKIWIASLVIIVVGGSAYWQRASIDPVSPVMSTGANAKSSVASKSNTPNMSSPLPQVASDEDESMLTDQDREDIRDWYKDSVHHQDYAAYDEASLLALADAGDVLAMKALVLHYSDMITKGTTTEELLEYSDKAGEMVEKAIIFGDREFLGSIPELSDATSRFDSPHSTPEEKYESMIEALALAEFMGMRGDLESKYNRQVLFFDIYNGRGAPDTLSDNEKQAIRDRAREIYDIYEQKRIELGLGPFDNSVSQGMAKQFEIERKIYLKKMGDKAI